MNNEVSVYKGGRGYIHATDLLDVASGLCDNFSNFVFTSRKTAIHPTAWVNAEDINKDLVVASFVATTVGGENKKYVAIQDVDRHVDDVSDFDEDNMLNNSKYKDESISVDMSEEYTLWEYISGLQKKLLSKLFDNKEWWFVRLEWASDIVSGDGNILVKYIGKKRILYRSEISINGQKVGVVEFASR